MGELTGKTVVVRGIGDATSPGVVIARAFAQAGADLALVGASSSKLREASKLVEESGVACMRVQVRHDDVEGVAAAVERIAERFGRIDALVNAALVARPQLLAETDPQDLAKTFRLCAEVPFAWMRACLPHLARQHGAIISLGSRFAQEAACGYGALAAATQGFQALNAIAAREWEELGVTANVVQAGARNARLDAWEGELAAGADADLPDSYEELARLCLRLASEEGRRETGRTLSVW